MKLPVRICSHTLVALSVHMLHSTDLDSKLPIPDANWGVLAESARSPAADTRGESEKANISFDRFYIDQSYGGNGRPGWVRAGDMDNDGDLDIVAGGEEALFIYENDGKARAWTRNGSLDGTGQIGCNGAALLDADGDGDLDVIAAFTIRNGGAERGGTIQNNVINGNSPGGSGGGLWYCVGFP